MRLKDLRRERERYIETDRETERERERERGMSNMRHKDVRSKGISNM